MKHGLSVFTYVALPARYTVVHHNTLGFEISHLGLDICLFRLCVTDGWLSSQFRQGAQVHGESDPVTFRIISLHRLDDVCEDGCVFADDEVGYGYTGDHLEASPDDIGP